MLWVVFEGIDGSGKTSQATSLARHLRRSTTVPVVYRHVFDTDVGKAVRRIFMKYADLSTEAETLLLTCARVRYAQRVLEPASQREAILLTDRFFDSIWAMQGMMPDADPVVIEAVESRLGRSFRPDLIVLLDAEARVCRERMRLAGKLDRIEAKSVEFHESVRRAFLSRLGDTGAAVVDANRPAAAVQAEIRSRVDYLVAARGLCRPAPEAAPSRRLAGRPQPRPAVLVPSPIAASSRMSASSFSAPERFDLSPV